MNVGLFQIRSSEYIITDGSSDMLAAQSYWKVHQLKTYYLAEKIENMVSVRFETIPIKMFKRWKAQAEQA